MTRWPWGGAAIRSEAPNCSHSRNWLGAPMRSVQGTHTSLVAMSPAVRPPMSHTLQAVGGTDKSLPHQSPAEPILLAGFHSMDHVLEVPRGPLHLIADLELEEAEAYFILFAVGAIKHEHQRHAVRGATVVERLGESGILVAPEIEFEVMVCVVGESGLTSRCGRSRHPRSQDDRAEHRPRSTFPPHPLHSHRESAARHPPRRSCSWPRITLPPADLPNRRAS